MLKAGGNINIGTYNDNKGANVTVALPGSVVQQTVPPEEQPQPTQEATPAETKPRKAPSKTKSAIQLKDFKGNKIGFLRVIKALHKEGFFETLDGGRPTEDDVFAAFGIAINEGLDDYSGQLSANRKDNTPETRSEVFDQLKKTYLNYEQDVESKKAARSSDKEK
jgi:hypothetical protein